MRVTLRQLIPAGCVVAVVAALIVVAQSRAGQSALRTLGVTGNPPGYTELAFVHPLRLPTALRSSPTPLRLPFTITNREGSRTTYRWSVTTSDPHARVNRSGMLQIGAGKRAYLAPRVRLTCTRRTRITISVNTGQAIDFWATCIVPQRRSPRHRKGPAPAHRRVAGRRGRTP